MVSMLYEVGRRFRQRDETIHLAVELLDRIFLSQDNLTNNTSRHVSTSESKLHGFETNFSRFDFSSKSTDRALYEITILLVSSKYDELDEYIP